MKESWASVVANFKSFIGSGWLMWGCFCGALLVCFFLGKDRRKKLFTVSLVLCITIINPIVYYFIGNRFMSGVYWRLFWTLPLVVTVAVALTELTGKLKNEWIRFFTVGALCLTILLTGKSVINRGTYVSAENDYQIPQAAIDVSDIVLEASGGNPTMMIVPDELVCYIRQYTGQIALAYGRNIWGFINDAVDWQMDLYNQMNAENIDYERLRESAYACGCRYIAFNSRQRELPKDMESYGYRFIDSAGEYMVYALE